MPILVLVGIAAIVCVLLFRRPPAPETLVESLSLTHEILEDEQRGKACGDLIHFDEVSARALKRLDHTNVIRFMEEFFPNAPDATDSLGNLLLNSLEFDRVSREAGFEANGQSIGHLAFYSFKHGQNVVSRKERDPALGWERCWDIGTFLLLQYYLQFRGSTVEHSQSTLTVDGKRNDTIASKHKPAWYGASWSFDRTVEQGASYVSWNEGENVWSVKASNNSYMRSTIAVVDPNMHPKLKWSWNLDLSSQFDHPYAPGVVTIWLLKKDFEQIADVRAILYQTNSARIAGEFKEHPIGREASIPFKLEMMICEVPGNPIVERNLVDDIKSAWPKLKLDEIQEYWIAAITIGVDSPRSGQTESTIGAITFTKE